MLTYTSVVRASVNGGHIHWELFFGAAAFLFGLDSLCLFRRKPFLVSISGRHASIVSLGESKNGFIFEIKEFGKYYDSGD